MNMIGTSLSTPQKMAYNFTESLTASDLQKNHVEKVKDDITVNAINLGGLTTTTAAVSEPAVALVPPNKNNKIDPNQLEGIKLRLNNNENHASYQLAGGMLTVIAGEIAKQFMPQPVSVKSTDSSAVNLREDNSSHSVDGSTSPRQMNKVENGTDLTPVDASKTAQSSGNSARYINVFGDLKMLRAFEQMTQTLLEQGIISDKMSAKFGNIMMKLAALCGKQMVAASEESLTGAIAGGVMGLGMQAGSSAMMVKGSRNQSKSNVNNLGQANTVNGQIRKLDTHINLTQQNLATQGQTMPVGVRDALTKHQVSMRNQVYNAETAHNKVLLNTEQKRIVGQYINQGAQTTNAVMQASYGVNSAQMNSESQQTRQAQDVAATVSNTYRESSGKEKKVSADIRDILNSIYQKLNDTFSTIASHLG